jgi:hypothetical protein
MPRKTLESATVARLVDLDHVRAKEGHDLNCNP